MSMSRIPQPTRRLNATLLILLMRRKGTGSMRYSLMGIIRGEKLRQRIRTGNESQSSKTLTLTRLSHSCCRISRTCTIVDPRYYKGSLTDFIKKQQITDVLFLNNSTVARNTGIAQLLGGLLPAGK